MKSVIKLIEAMDETPTRKPTNKELSDSMVKEFKEKMDAHAVDPAAILEGIRNSYITEADGKLAELQKQKDYWNTLKHNLTK